VAYVDTKGNWSQRNQRRGQMFTDQHGRKYYGSIELKSGATCGVIESQYTSVLPVPMMYLERSRNPQRPYDLYVNYDRWISDVRLELNEWETRARALARRRNADYDSSQPLPTDVVEMMGERPQAVEPVLAARQGNGWVLGFRATIDERLRKFFKAEAIDPDYGRFGEPDFRDAPEYSAEAYQIEDGEFSDGPNASRTPEAFAPKPLFEDEDDGALDVLSLEEQIDPRAVGGKIQPVRANKPDLEMKKKSRQQTES
jgi:hypothetical protein